MSDTPAVAAPQAAPLVMTVPPEMAAKLRALSARTGVPLSEVAGQVIANGVYVFEKKQQGNRFKFVDRTGQSWDIDFS